jgi:hypothetical protein
LVIGGIGRRRGIRYAEQNRRRRVRFIGASAIVGDDLIIDSEPGAGTTVTVSLMLVAEASAERTMPTEAAA